MTAIGEVVLTLRRARGLTQEQLAGRAGLTQAALSRYEQGLRSPDEQTVSALAAALDVTSRFIQRAGHEHAVAATALLVL